MFACFPAVIFLTSPFAGPFMSRHGKKWVYTTGLIVVAISTICFSVASYMPAGSPFATWCPPPNTHTHATLSEARRAGRSGWAERRGRPRLSTRRLQPHQVVAVHDCIMIHRSRQAPPPAWSYRIVLYSIECIH